MVEPLSVIKVTVPPAPVFEKPVTIELPFVVFVPFAAAVKLCDINVTLPVVLQLILVNVLLPILVVKFALATDIKVIDPLPTTVCPVFAKLLPFTFKTLVALAEPDGYVIPTIAPEALALCKEIVLLLTLLVKVAVGVLDAPAT